MPMLPAALQTRPRFAFVPRTEAWNELTAAWDAARQGGRHLVLIRGEPGAGKTRLAAEFARAAAGGGGTVRFGQCLEEGGPPYEALAEALGGLPGAQAPSVPDGGLTGGARRAELFRDATETLAALTAEAPVLLLLDDLHWARRPTVQLLLHLLRATETTRSCIVATYRDAPDDLGEAFAGALAELHRFEGVTRILVEGLDDAGVAAFVETASGSVLDETLTRVVAVLREQTDGNPFLLGELWRHLVETGALTRDADGGWCARPEAQTPGSPDAVRSVVGSRVDRLPKATRTLLEIAAIVGSPFSLDVVAESAGGSIPALLDVIEPAIANATIEDAGGGNFRFAHALVHRAIYDRLSLTRRTQLHLDVARAIERNGVSDRTLPELARHYMAAVPLADTNLAVTVAWQAADAAMRSTAYEDAADILEHALPLVDEPASRGKLLLQLAEAHLSAGDTERVQVQAGTVIEIARAEGRPDLLTHAALAFEEASWRLGLPGDRAEALLREALPGIDDESTRIRALAARGRALALSGAPGADAVVDEAIAAARTHGDPVVLHFTLSAWFNLPWRPERYPRMLERADELRDLARRSGDLSAWAEVNAQQWLVISLLLNCQFADLPAASTEHTRLTERTRQPFHRHLAAAGASTFALMAGRFDEAERLADRANTLSAMLSGADTSGAYGVQMFSLRREQGRLEEVRPVVEAIVRLDRAHATWRPGLAAVYAELGLLDEARAEVKHLVDPTLRRVPRDALFLGSLTYLADAAVAVGDRTAAAILYAALEPYQGTIAIVGHLIACYGAVDRYLGSLAETAGRARDAERHFAAAVDIDTRSGSPVWLAHSRYRYAQFLVRQNRRDGRRRAATLLDDVGTTARLVGMPVIDARARALRHDLHDDTTNAPHSTNRIGNITTREREILACLVDGLSNAEIGRTLHVSANTAANHVRSILAKTGCANRTEAATWAVRNGVVAR